MNRTAWNYYSKFLSWDIEKQTKELSTRPASFWSQLGEQKALEVFHAAAERVPAYKKFLLEHNIDHKSVRTLEEFKKVPAVTKHNYLTKYPLHELSWDGKLDNQNVISVSSGSTGSPFFWPRDSWQEKEVDHLYELTLRDIFGADEKPTLVIIAFAIGMYIAGPFTFASILRIGQKGYPISITTPSNDIAAVIRVVQNLAPEFKQVVIGGYPPLVKDIIDTGIRSGVAWDKLSTKLFFGGEGFSEKWRDYIHTRLGTANNLATTVNMYGTADAALLGIETPTSIAFRRFVDSNKAMRREVFNDERLPSVVTYNPLLKYFESLDDGTLLFTSSSGIPLVRYKIGDVGGIISHDEIESRMAKAGTPLEQALKQSDVLHTHWQLPLVYLFGRNDFTVQLYGANVYPENIKEALDDQRITGLVSGKFVIATKHKPNMDPYLDLKIELASGVNPEQSILTLLKQVIIETLRLRNSEYEVIFSTIKRKAEPHIKLKKFGHRDFTFKIKHTWVNKLG